MKKEDSKENSVDKLIKALSKEYKQKEFESCDYFISTGSTLLDYIISNDRVRRDSCM